MLKTGLKTYALRDEDGEAIATIRFNPTDPAIITRFAEAGGKIKELVDKTDIEAEPLALNRLNEEVKGLFDYALTGNRNSHGNSDSLFAFLAPTASIGDGHYYFEAVYDEIKNIIEPAIEQSAEESEKRVSAYIDKYKPADGGND